MSSPSLTMCKIQYQYEHAKVEQFALLCCLLALDNKRWGGDNICQQNAKYIIVFDMSTRNLGVATKLVEQTQT